jgi:diadenosine tetraphosphate (Ap4A) HIT family hydrolase
MAVVFLNRYPTLYGYTLVAPLEHREHVTGDFNLDEYLQIQELIYRVAEAVRLETNAERVYLLSLGSQQANSHVHWHIAPLPGGIPFDEQQLKALSFESGILELTEDEKSSIARRIRNRIEVLAGA